MSHSWVTVDRDIHECLSLHVETQEDVIVIEEEPINLVPPHLGPPYGDQMDEVLY